MNWPSWRRRPAHGCARKDAGHHRNIVRPLLACLDTVDHTQQRLPALKWALFTQMDATPWAWDGGLLNAFLGSIIMSGLAILNGVTQ